MISSYANPNLVKFAEVLLEKVDKKDFVAGVVGQNIVLEGMAFSVFEMMYAMQPGDEPEVRAHARRARSPTSAATSASARTASAR